MSLHSREIVHAPHCVDALRKSDSLSPPIHSRFWGRYILFHHDTMYNLIEVYYSVIWALAMLCEEDGKEQIWEDTRGILRKSLPNLVTIWVSRVGAPIIASYVLRFGKGNNISTQSDGNRRENRRYVIVLKNWAFCYPKYETVEATCSEVRSTPSECANPLVMIISWFVSL